MRATWVFAVASLITRSAASSAFERPRAIRRSTSSSRGVSSSSSRGGGVGALPDESLDQPPRDRGRDQRVAARDDLDRADELVAAGVLQQEPARPGAQRLEHVLVEVEGREDQHGDRIGDARPGELSGRLDAAHARHAHVHQHDVRAQPPREGHGLAPVARLAQHLDAARLEDHAEAVSHELLVVGDQHPQRHGPACSGMRAATRKPPPGGPRRPACRPRARPARASPPDHALPPPGRGAAPGRRRAPRARTRRVDSGSTTWVATLPAWRSVFVSASCTIRYAERSTLAGSGRASPSSASETSRPAARTSPSSSSSWARPGVGACSGDSSSVRSRCSSRRSSTRLSLPTVSMRVRAPATCSASPARGLCRLGLDHHHAHAVRERRRAARARCASRSASAASAAFSSRSRSSSCIRCSSTCV